MTAAMKQLAGGRSEVEVPGIGRSDEIGEMAETVEVFKTNAAGAAAARGRAEGNGGARRGAAQGRHQQARRRFRGRGRRDHRDRVVGVDRTGSVRHDADVDRGAVAAIGDGGGGGVGRSLHQRAVGGLRDRGDVLVGQRDQPPGAGIGADRQRGGRPGAQDQRPGRRTVEGRGADRRRGRTDQHHRRPDQPAGAERHHRGGARRRGRPRLRRGGVAR